LKRDRTRASLLEAARALIREKGYERTTLEEVASRARMTTGAIYGNFKNRDELFIALGQTYWAPVKPQIKPGRTRCSTRRLAHSRRSILGRSFHPIYHQHFSRRGLRVELQTELLLNRREQ